MTSANRPGDVLAGRYRLVDLLVESGRGRFWRALDTVLDRHVAVHVIAADDGRAAPLLAAARRSTAVVDRRVLRVLDAAVHDDVCYVVNEWGTGVSLDILVGGGTPLAPRHAAWVTAEVADVAALAHHQGLAHGRLSPENVLVDQHGAVRVIGLCVDAALHGLPFDRPSADITDLAGLLYCGLTATWAGGSGSSVRTAPVDHGQVLRPRRVRAGVPRPLDELCDVVLHAHAGTRGRLDEVTAASIAERLHHFVGDPGGLSEALAATLPPARERFPVVLPQVPPVVPHDDQAGPDLGPDTEPEEPPAPESEDQPTVLTPAPAYEEQLTQATLTPFDDETGHGDLTATRAVTVAREERPSPPPPFPDPPARPLFAPDPPEGAPARRARATATAAAGQVEDASGAALWPWDTGSASSSGTGPNGGSTTGSGVLPAVTDPVPGRSWLRLALVLTLLLVLLVGAVVAVNLGRGRTPLGAEPDPTTTPTPTTGASPSADPTPLEGLRVKDLDPQGEAPFEENPDQVGLAVDGDPATGWTTSTYFQQLGPSGLKTGLGLVVDLGDEREVAAVDLTLGGSPTNLTLFAADEAPSGVGGLTEIGAADQAGERAEVVLDEPVATRYVVVWLTALPAVEGGFRGDVREITVLGG